ncbi:phosphoglycerate dehydrogenase [Alphaproteobacteria bacterium]|jgi:D-3-phosphoglycerate dehydrogenase|nr:phosphoglycerate dehydrogenase [Alphaproteobacteria bacterium]
MPKVLISDKLSQDAVKVFEDRGVDVDFKAGIDKGELLKIIGNYDGLAIRSATKVTQDVLDAGENLKVVGRAGIGVDNIDLDAASQKGVVVMNTPFGNTTTTAEHAIAMMMSMARQIPAANASTQAGKWEKNRFMGVEITSKTLGVIGCGNIGTIVVDRAKGLKMRVIIFDPFLTEDRAQELGAEKVELDDLFRRSDFITVHTPLIDATRNIINAESIAKMKDGVRIINCARGGIVNEEDLRAAMDSGKVAGAALDVFVDEPAQDNKLFGHDEFVATPHLGAATTEAQEIVAVQVAEQMSDYLLTGAVQNAINAPSVSAEDAPKLRPYMALGENLGGFAGQLTETGLSAVTIEFHGAVTQINTRPLVSCVLNGLLRPMMDNVNMVSAPIVAKDRGIDVSVVTNENPDDYENLIRVTVRTERRERCVSGTLFGGNRPRVVEINGTPIEAELGEHMLYVTNKDEPGVIGAIGGALGTAGVNIATFHLGRMDAGSEAIALIQIDGAADDNTLTALRALPNVTQVKALAF